MPEGREEIYMQRYEWQNQAYWSDRAEGYSRVNRDELDSGQHRVWGETLAERIAAAYPGRRNEEITVLDIGTGPGFFAIILAERGYRVTAVDYTDSMLEKARLNAGIWRDRITFLKMNAEELQLPDRSFDVIVSRNVTWNLHDPVKAYGEWTRVLKEGGLLLNFDANWYRYLYDEEARKGYCATVRISVPRACRMRRTGRISPPWKPLRTGRRCRPGSGRNGISGRWTPWDGGGSQYRDLGKRYGREKSGSITPPRPCFWFRRFAGGREA